MQLVKFEKHDLISYMDNFCDLYHKTFTAKANKDIIEQRYLQNPYDDLLMYVAIDNGKIIANYSAVPLKVSIEGKIKNAALSLNTMTDPEYAGRGLFPSLANSLYDYLQQNEYLMIIGFPNNLSNRIFNNWLGWHTVYEIPTLKLDLGSVETDLVSSNSQFISGYRESLDVYIKEKVFVCRSKKYLEWRYKNNKEKLYHFISLDNCNWAIFQFYGEEINITELFADDISKEQALIKQIIQIGIEQHFKYITVWYKTNTKTHNYLEKTGFRLASPIRTFGVRCFDESFADVVYDARNWWIQMGDDNSY